MTRGEFLRALEGQLEMPHGSLSETQQLTDVDGWDSMSALLFMALADEKAGVTITGDQLAKARTMGDLLSLLGDALAP
jgi:acyl carrier protein